MIPEHKLAGVSLRGHELNVDNSQAAQPADFRQLGLVAAIFRCRGIGLKRGISIDSTSPTGIDGLSALVHSYSN